jgi:hypothetical protein
MEHFNPPDAEITKAFNVTQDELDTARQLQQMGTFTPTPNLDFDAYANKFSTQHIDDTSNEKPSTATSFKSPIGIGVDILNRTSIQKPKSNKTPQTATKTPGKRGRKGNNIATAFGAIPSTPVAIEQFASEHNVSIAVLRQSRRFDRFPETGKVYVRKDKTSGNLMVWRGEKI